MGLKKALCLRTVLSRGLCLVAGLVLLVGTLTPSAVHAYRLEGQKWPTPTTAFSVYIPGADGLWDRSFEGAEYEWSARTPFQLLIRRGVYANPCNTDDWINGVGFNSTNCGASWGATTLAVTHYWYVGSTMKQADIVFNSNKPWNVYPGPLQAYAFDFRRVAVHELGHVIGLDHEDSGVASIMASYVGNLEVPQQDDINGVIALYPTIKASAPAGIDVPSADGDGSYTVQWGSSATGGATYLLQEATNAAFTSGLRDAYSGTGTSANITGRTSGVIYYYRVRATKTGYLASGWQSAGNGCAVKITCAAPSVLTVPVADGDGSYSVQWGASVTDGVTYVLQEATNPIFTANLLTVYTGTALAKTLKGRAKGKTYYYRVQAKRANYKKSSWLVAEAGCAVPGKTPVPVPTDLTVPAADADGTYTVAWTSSTVGAVFLLEEATNSTFTAGLRNVCFGTAKKAKITGRLPEQTYFYRVMAVKPGRMDSEWTPVKSCAVGGPG